jgi:hypothetical protein
MIRLCPKFLLLAIFACFSQFAFAQEVKSSLVGVSALADYEPDNGVKPSIGLLFEHRLTKRSGIEAGIFYKTNKTELVYYYIDPIGPGDFPPVTVDIRESFVTFPILYRYYTQAMTVSIGPVFEGFVGWNQISGDEVEVTGYELSPSFRYGPLLKVSKPFPLGDKLSLEPELRFGIMVNGISTAYYGLGVQLKQRL